MHFLRKGYICDQRFECAGWKALPVLSFRQAGFISVLEELNVPAEKYQIFCQRLYECPGWKAGLYKLLFIQIWAD